MKLTTIQLYEGTKNKLEQKKLTPRESYDQVINRILEQEEIPTLDEAFRMCDELKQTRRYSTKDVLELSHGWRDRHAKIH